MSSEKPTFDEIARLANARVIEPLFTTEDRANAAMCYIRDLAVLLAEREKAAEAQIAKEVAQAQKSMKRAAAAVMWGQPEADEVPHDVSDWAVPPPTTTTIIAERDAAIARAEKAEAALKECRERPVLCEIKELRKALGDLLVASHDLADWCSGAMQVVVGFPKEAGEGALSRHRRAWTQAESAWGKVR